MPAYFYGLKKEELSAHPILYTHLALLSAMDGDLSQAKAICTVYGEDTAAGENGYI